MSDRNIAAQLSNPGTKPRYRVACGFGTSPRKGDGWKSVKAVEIARGSAQKSHGFGVTIA